MPNQQLANNVSALQNNHPASNSLFNCCAPRGQGLQQQQQQLSPVRQQQPEEMK